MSKTLIFSAPQGNSPDIVLKIDDTGRHMVLNTGDGAGEEDFSIEEGEESQTAELFQALADQATLLVPGRPSSFVREWTKLAAELSVKVTPHGWNTDRMAKTLSDGVEALRGAMDAGDEKETALHLTALSAALMAMSHQLGARVSERLERCV